jgi:hypothetical protein
VRAQFVRHNENPLDTLNLGDIEGRKIKLIKTTVESFPGFIFLEYKEVKNNMKNVLDPKIIFKKGKYIFEMHFDLADDPAGKYKHFLQWYRYDDETSGTLEWQSNKWTDDNSIQNITKILKSRIKSYITANSKKNSKDSKNKKCQ